MGKILCNHNMHTTKFMTKIHDEGKVIVEVIEGVPVKIDERIAARYPSTFEIVEAHVADSEEEKVEPETATDESEIIETGGTEGKTLVDVFEDLDDKDKVDVDAVKIELLEAIEGFKNKKKLDDYAKGLGVELDRRKTLKDMKSDLKIAWELDK